MVTPAKVLQPPPGGITKRLHRIFSESPWLVTILLVGLVFLLRMPLALVPREFNVDESQMLAQAMKFLVDPQPWKAVDGTTMGPLNFYIIAFVLLLGLKPGFVTIHLLANVLICLQILVTSRTLARIGSERTALIGASLTAILYAFAVNLDYRHFANELVSTLFLALGFYLYLVWLKGPSERSLLRLTTLILLCGVALGAAPWGKIQAAPMTLGVGLVVLAAVFWHGSYRRSQRTVQALAFFVGGLLPGGIILAITARAGAIKDFWYSYVLAVMAHAGPASLTQMLAHAGRLLVERPINQLLLVSVVALALLAYSSRMREVALLFERQRWVFIGLLVYAGSTLFAICRPATVFIHYQLYLVPPMTYITAVLADRDWSSLRKQWNLRRPGAVIIAGAAIFTFMLYAVNGARYVHTIVYVYRTARWQPDSNDIMANGVREIQKERPVKTMTIWGWAPGVHVLTGIPPATRDVTGAFVITKEPLQQYFLKRFVRDLQEAKPDLFIDAVVQGAHLWTWSTDDGYDSVPEVRQFIQNNYILIREVSLVPGGKPARFFVRRQVP